MVAIKVAVLKRFFEFEGQVKGMSLRVLWEFIRDMTKVSLHIGTFGLLIDCMFFVFTY